MVKFACIKEVDLKDPKKCDGCIFLDLIETGAEAGVRYCTATDAGWMIKTPGRPNWCPLVLNYKDALRASNQLLRECFGASVTGSLYDKVRDFRDMIEKELGKDGSLSIE